MTPKGELSRPGQRQMVEQRRQAGSQVGVVPVVVVAVGQAARRSRPGPQRVVEHRRRAGSQVEEVPVTTTRWRWCRRGDGRLGPTRYGGRHQLHQVL